MSEYTRYSVRIELQGEKEHHVWRKIEPHLAEMFMDEGAARLVFGVLTRQLKVYRRNEIKIANEAKAAREKK